jgi:hypothetical protein
LLWRRGVLKNVKLPCLAYATTKLVRHLLARSLTQRYAPALAGLTAGQRWRLLARPRSASATRRFPRQSATTCGSQYNTGTGKAHRSARHRSARHRSARHTEGPLCQVPPEGRAPRGNRHTRGERLPRGPKSLGRHRQGMGGRHRGAPRHHDPSPDSLRPEPGPSAPKQARDRHAASEPAWRLLHAITLRQFHQARTRVHMAHHAQGGPHEAKRATPRHILRAVRQRVTGQVHDKAKHAMRGQPKPAPGKGASTATGSPPG